MTALDILALASVLDFVGDQEGLFSTVNRSHFAAYAAHIKCAPTRTATGDRAIVSSIARLQYARSNGFERVAQFSVGKWATLDVLLFLQPDINWSTCAGACTTGSLARFLLIYHILSQSSRTLEQVHSIVRCAAFSGNIELVTLVFQSFDIYTTSPCMDAALAMASDLEMSELFKVLWCDLKGASLHRLHWAVRLKRPLLEWAFQHIVGSTDIPSSDVMYICGNIARLGCIKTVEYIISISQTLYSSIKGNSSMMLATAITYGNTDLIRWLVNWGAEWPSNVIFCTRETLDVMDQLGFTGLCVVDEDAKDESIHTKRQRIQPTLNTSSYTSCYFAPF